MLMLSEPLSNSSRTSLTIRISPASAVSSPPNRPPTSLSTTNRTSPLNNGDSPCKLRALYLRLVPLFLKLDSSNQLPHLLLSSLLSTLATLLISTQELHPSTQAQVVLSLRANRQPEENSQLSEVETTRLKLLLPRRRMRMRTHARVNQLSSSSTILIPTVMSASAPRNR